MKKPEFTQHIIGKILKKHRHRLPKSLSNVWVKNTLIGLGILAIVGGLIGFIFVISVISDTPTLPSQFFNAESTIIYDRDGNILYTIHGEENRKEIPLSEIPKHVIDATIAIEDDQFFDHYGFDVGGIVKGVLSEFFGIGVPRGGSTITQQLVKNTLLTSERTIKRKLKELLLAIQVERTFTKNEILSLYLNTIPYGSNAYGIEMASRIFFDKHAADLSLGEAAILASLPQAPSRYNPYSNGRDLLMGSFDEEGNYVPGRKDLVLGRMVDLGFITEEERQEAFDEAAEITFQTYREDITYPHFVLYVKELLENKFGKEAVETGGLRVYTTIDPAIQDKAEEVITERIASYPDRYDATNAALLSVDTEKGFILAMVGSADYFNEEIDGNVNVVFRNRLPGSSFKPIVYATGFAKGYSPATIFYDLETDFGNNYIPQNYDGSFNGPVSARRALASSLNIPAVKMAFLAGTDNVVNQAKKMGLSDLIDGDQYGTSIGLGTGEANLYQMVTAFTVFAKNGKKISFTPFLRIETSDGKVIESNEEREPKESEVLDPQIAYSINHILSDKSARPAGWNALQLKDHINGAKTGTSNKRFKEGNVAGAIKPLDNWTIGYTTKVVTGVWVGNNDASPMNHQAAGLTTAAPIWNAVMTEATKNDDLEPFPKPPGINWVKVSKRSGLLPSQHTDKNDVVSELFTTFNTPTEVDKSFITLEVDSLSKKLPTEFTPEESIVEALVANFHSLNPTDPNWERPVKAWSKKFLADYASGDRIILAEVPTEYDDVHNPSSAQDRPRISITNPSDSGAISTGFIEVQVNIDAPHGVEDVKYYLDQRFVTSTDQFPYTGKIRIPRQKNGKQARIGVTVQDGLFYESSDTINVEVSRGEDNVPPQTAITYPEEGAIFPASTTINVQTLSTDNNSIDQVSFYLDDRLIGTTTTPPYQYSIELPEEIAGHTIVVIAKDIEGNTAQDEVMIRIEEDDDEGRAKTEFTFPKAGSRYSVGSPIEFFFQLEQRLQNSAKQVEVSAYNLDTETSSIIYSAAANNGASQNFSFSWIPQGPGSFEFTISVTTENDSIRESSPLPLTIE